MNTQETLEQAMLNRKAVTFHYNRLGKIHAEEIGNAHIILISTRFGKKTITVDVAQNDRAMMGWKNFDLNNISKVEIVN
jgi:hypothetical protein